MRAVALAFAVTLAASVSLGGCKSKSSEDGTSAATPDAGGLPGGLTEEQSKRVIAKVGDRTITLGEYAAELERMNEFDRMRYQSPEKRKELLDQMIDLELLAIEAKRRGLENEPETQEQIRQVLRDVMLSDARKSLPAPADLSQEEVRAYYDAHRDDYREPERRRVAVIAFKDHKEAEKVLPDALKATPMEFGKLVQKYADDAAVKPGPSRPLETLGDLGIVSAPNDPKGDNPRVPKEIRAAVFEITKDAPSVLEHVVDSGDKTFIVKLASKSAAHERTFAEAERSIRGVILQKKIEERTQELQKELEKQLPVSIDDAALAKVQIPSAKAPDAPAPSSSAKTPPRPR